MYEFICILFKGDGVVGGVTTMIECDIGPWFKSTKPGYNMF